MTPIHELPTHHLIAFQFSNCEACIYLNSIRTFHSQSHVLYMGIRIPKCVAKSLVRNNFRHSSVHRKKISEDVSKYIYICYFLSLTGHAERNCEAKIFRWQTNRIKTKAQAFPFPMFNATDERGRVTSPPNKLAPANLLTLPNQVGDNSAPPLISFRTQRL